MSRPVLILLISALVMLGPFTNNIIVPSLPALATDMRIGFGHAQAILSIFMVGFAAGQLFVGPMSDRFGRKPVLTMSLVLFIIASVLCSIAPDLYSLCAARLIQALGASATLSVGRAIVRDSFDSDKMAQVYAYVGTALALGPIVGPIFGGVIEVAAGWRSVFLFLAGFGCLMLLTIVFLLRETNLNLNRDATRPARLIGNYATLLSTRLYMGYVLCNAICYGGIFAFTSCSAYILIGLLGVSPDVFGALYAITVSAYGVGTLVASQITRRVGINRMIVYGGLIMTIFGEIGVILPMLGYFNIWTVVLPFAGFAFGTGFVFPSGQAGGISPYPKMAGAASSMLSCLQMSTAAVIGAVTARMLDGSMMPMAWAVFGMGPVLLLSFYLLVLRNPRDKAATTA
ncbi:MAG: DHA1 family bicyclomycin/chloramphenicol resistance-like MFS transporter [Paracoccaceae bacterium]|jgi:DHA1 family bicyclomycin/chloramphenicol resistance-like MFS transporter